jgi:O-methyltransferase
MEASGRFGPVCAAGYAPRSSAATPVKLKEIAIGSARKLLTTRAALRLVYPDFDEPTLAILKRVLPYTMTSPARIAAVCSAVRYAETNNIPGAFVECGVWRGGSSMAAALSFQTPRPLFLYDTFEGMTSPTEHDRRATTGKRAADMLPEAANGAASWCYSPLEDVRRNMASTGYPSAQVAYIQGKVEDTIPAAAPEQISVLRLDTDWYESTRHELEHLYPRLAPGGVLIIDDYGYWAGARKAVDEYFKGSLFLSRIDDTGRIAIKPPR